jgi:stage V sporulation protein G
MNVTEVSVQLAPPAEGVGVSNRLKAFCSITLDGAFAIRDIKIIDGPKGMFVAMPSRKVTAHCPNCQTKNFVQARFCNQCGSKLSPPILTQENERPKMHCDVAHPINMKCRQIIEKAIISAYLAKLHAPAGETATQQPAAVQ